MLRESVVRVNDSEKEKKIFSAATSRSANVSKGNFLDVKVEVIMVHLADKVCYNSLGLYDKMTRILI